MPELDPGQRVALRAEHRAGSLAEATALGIATRPVVPGWINVMTRRARIAPGASEPATGALLLTVNVMGVANHSRWTRFDDAQPNKPLRRR